MIYYIGIDPSINSTGICIQKYDGDTKISEYFLIVTGKSKLTKKEQIANDSIYELEYVLYNKKDLKEFKTNNYEHEYWKTINIMSLIQKIKDTIYEFTKDNPEYTYILMEGISYGSVSKTKSIYDLAGLNYLIRSLFINKDNTYLYIATPSEIKKFASGNGNCNKDVMVSLFLSINNKYIIVPKVDDICDAWFMSNLCKTKAQ